MRVVQPEGFPRAQGYANGVITEGPLLHIAGQIGWQSDQTFESDDLVEQFAAALDNVLAVVTAAGGQPHHVASMTIYVTDMDAYRSARSQLGTLWQARFGRHYPVMALVGVGELVEPRAKVEIAAVATLPTRVTESNA